MMDPKAPMIYITAGPSAPDPLDQAPIGFIHGSMGRFIQMSALFGPSKYGLLPERNWRVRLAIWVLRRYVARAIGGK